MLWHVDVKTIPSQVSVKNVTCLRKKTLFNRLFISKICIKYVAIFVAVYYYLDLLRIICYVKCKLENIRFFSSVRKLSKNDVMASRGGVTDFTVFRLFWGK